LEIKQGYTMMHSQPIKKKKCKLCQTSQNCISDCHILSWPLHKAIYTFMCSENKIIRYMH